MSLAIHPIMEQLHLIFKKLENVELKLLSLKECDRLVSDELLISRLKSMMTSLELLRNEIEELHQLIVILFNSK